MLRKTIVTAATAAAIAATSLAATTSPAAAGNAKWSFSAGYYTTKVVYVPRRHCRPIYKKVRWRDYRGRWHWKTVRAGERCKTVYVKDYRRVWVPVFGYNKPHWGKPPHRGPKPPHSGPKRPHGGKPHHRGHR